MKWLITGLMLVALAVLVGCNSPSPKYINNATPPRGAEFQSETDPDADKIAAEGEQAPGLEPLDEADAKKAEAAFDSAARETAKAVELPAGPWAKVKPANYHTEDSGLIWAELQPGSGAEAKQGDRVAVHYTGWLKDGGAKFDSSLDRGQPIEFPLGAGRVIEGWDEGVAGMKVGERRQLIIPPEMAYGAHGAPPDIPPNATLVFEVELMSIN